MWEDWRTSQSEFVAPIARNRFAKEAEQRIGFKTREIRTRRNGKQVKYKAFVGMVPKIIFDEDDD